MILCSCATKNISIVDDLCTRHKSGYDTYSKTLRADGAHHLPASEWIAHRLQAEIEHPTFYAELNRQESEPKSEWGGYIEKMRAGLAAAVLAIDHLLGPNWFRADPDHVAAVQGCLDGLDAHQILTSMGVFPPPKRVLNFVTQRVKLDGYLGDGITDICGCTEVVEDGHQLCPFHRQHYFAYRQKADPATMLRVQQWTQKRRSGISVWAIKGALR